VEADQATRQLRGCPAAKALLVGEQLYLGYLGAGGFVLFPSDLHDPDGPANPSSTPRELAPPGGFGTDVPVVAPGGTVLVGRPLDGLWAAGPGVQTTDGVVPCPMQPILGFGRIWRTEPGARSRLGCPLEAERPVRVRERIWVAAAPPDRPQTRRAYWLEDASDHWYEVREPSALGPASWSSWPKQAVNPSQAWPDPPDAVLDGAMQQFEAGLMLFLIHPDGSRTIQVLGAFGSWSEYPD
jgi:hypothetical protein